MSCAPWRLPCAGAFELVATIELQAGAYHLRTAVSTCAGPCGDDRQGAVWWAARDRRKQKQGSNPHACQGRISMPHQSRHAFVLAVAVTAITVLGTMPHPGSDTDQLAAQSLLIDRSWAKMPEGRIWGSTSAVDIDPDGTSVWVGGALRRARLLTAQPDGRGAPFNCEGSKLDPILKFDASGKLVKSFGAGLTHLSARHPCRSRWQCLGRRRLGTGGKGQQVFKFSPDGRLLLTLGKAGVAGDGPTRSTRRRRSSSRRTATSSSPTATAATPTRAS